MELSKCPLCDSSLIDFFITNFKNKDFWKCKKRSFVFNAETEIPNYADASWTHVVDPDGKIRDLSKEREFKMKNWYGDIVSYVETLSPGKILDIGCGLGYLISSFSDKWEKYGFEISKFALSHIKNNFPEVNMINDIDLENSEPPKHHQENYDVILCYHVIEHIRNPDIFFKHLNMLIKPQGLLIIGTPNMSSLAAKIFKGNFRLLGDDGHVGLFNDQTMTLFLKENHYKIIKTEYPFFKTDYFTVKNLLKILNVKGISPPFYGNIMTYYAQKTK